MTLPPHIRLGFAIEAKGEHPNLVDQVHGTRVVAVSSHVEKADGVFTMDPEKEVYVFTADCAPLLFYTESSDGPVAAVHSGWRGTKDGIPSEAVRTLSQWRDRLHVVIGPCLLECCFEVKDDFVEAFRAAGKDISPYLSLKNGEKHFDHLRYIVGEELREIDLERIHTEAAKCTKCSSPALPSYRRNKVTDPRIRGWIRKRNA